MIPPFRAYLFDVDGTLLDSAADISAAMRATVEAAGIAGLSDEFLRRFIGYHLRDLFLEVLPGLTPEQIDEMVQFYRRIYLAREHRSTRLYPGVPEMLSRLGGLKSTATTKSSETARNVLTRFGLVQHFDHVQGTDGFPSKPEPDVIFKSVERLGVRPDECLLIGDAAPDMEAGRRAGVKTCAVTYGYGNLEHMRAHQPDYWVGSALELVE